MRALLAAMLPVLIGACSRQEPQLPIVEPTPTNALFIDKRFEDLYPIFLVRKSMSQGDKARMWNLYVDRWVRWEGVITSFTDKGITVKVLLATTTFDVSLTCDASQLAPLKTRFALGDRVQYVGRLDSFDDIFRTLYLTHGVVTAKLPQGDLGVAADLSR